MPQALSHVDLKLVNSLDGALEFKRWLGQSRPALGVDTETAGLQPNRHKVRLVQFGDLDTGWAIPWEGWGGVAMEALEQYEGQLVLHNSKFDARMINHWSNEGLTKGKFTWPWHRTDDTMAMAHLLDPLRPKGLKALGSMLVDPRAAGAERMLHDAMVKNKWTWATIPTDFPYYWIYGAMDPVITCHLREQFTPEVQAKYAYPYELEMGVHKVLYDMERYGARIDPVYCEDKARQLHTYADQLTDWARAQYGISNPGSGDQLLKFFEREGVPMLDKRTKGGKQSMDVDVMESIDHPLAEQVLNLRKARKIADTYLVNLVEFADSEDILHATIWAAGTRTARMSITDPALQTLPRKDPTVRTAFIPREGHSLITCDYDQIEARLTAHFSEDPGLIAAFGGDDDFFCTIAGSIFNEPVSKKDPRRQLTKNTIYGKIYGAGVEKMAMTARVPFDDMARVVAGFDTQYPGVVQMQRKINNLAASRQRNEGRGYINTPTGRIMVSDDNKEYTLTNYLIQCHASEILKRKLIELSNVLDEGMMILPVHDEVIFDVPADDAEELKHLIEQTMADTTNYRVPITASADLLRSDWGEKYR